MVSVCACPGQVGGLDAARDLFKLVGRGVDGLGILARKKVAVQHNQLRVLVEEDQVHHRVGEEILPPAGDRALPYIPGLLINIVERQMHGCQVLLTLAIVKVIEDRYLEGPIAGETQGREARRAFLDNAVE